MQPKVSIIMEYNSENSLRKYNNILNQTHKNIDLNNRNQIQLLGFRKDVQKLLKSSDLYVFPSLGERLNVSLIEAMCTGKSCIETLLVVICKEKLTKRLTKVYYEKYGEIQ